ncbi:SCO1 protein [Gymnopus androsaceus JB14]|uniref:SCO1 protein n=1 Tax=Gymnopus androsaceus JB14 TaxID=1447944 RepID=A0A6A4IIN7_9AGAR|nr:SCO1 protein [Gymnopus androsaceus JB14]
MLSSLRPFVRHTSSPSELPLCSSNTKTTRRDFCRTAKTVFGTASASAQCYWGQVFSPTSAALFIATGAGLLWYFRNEKARLVEEREKERMSKSYGRPHVGGPFSLINCTSGQRFTHEDLLGKWSLVYFGFTNCPDICPAELDKVTAVVNELGKSLLLYLVVHIPNGITSGQDLSLQPVFISVDPARDTPSTIRTYLADFHSSFIGLVGNYQETKSVCKAYRVYFSTPPDADPKGDYLVDHSIFVYLMDPEGRFVEAFGQVAEKEEIVDKIKQFVIEWSR